MTDRTDRVEEAIDEAENLIHRKFCGPDCVFPKGCVKPAHSSRRDVWQIISGVVAAVRAEQPLSACFDDDCQKQHILAHDSGAEQPQRECFHCGLPYSEKPEQPQAFCENHRAEERLVEIFGRECFICAINRAVEHRLAAQPQQAIAPIGHAANCHCHDKECPYGDCECCDYCVHGVDQHPYVDSRCLPSLLREAELIYRIQVNGSGMTDDEARAAVDRLRAEMKDAKPTAT